MTQNRFKMRIAAHSAGKIRKKYDCDIAGWVKERNPTRGNDNLLWVTVIAFCEVKGKMGIAISVSREFGRSLIPVSRDY